jgi:Bacterial regulatory proteins, lacI family
VSLLVDIAERAHVSVEGVVRVLTREPVSDAIKERVLAVLDELDPEQTRVLQRFALAALHDVIPRPHEAMPDVDMRAPERVDLPRALLPPAPPETPAEPAVETPAELPAPAEAAHLVQLSAVLEELAGAVRDLRRETDTERRERVDDLAVLIELISTGWQGLDRRLGRLERQLGRLESGRVQPGGRQAPPPPPPRAPAPARAAEPEPEPVGPPVVPAAAPATADAARSRRDRLPLAAALALVGLVVGMLAVLQIASGDAELAGVVSARTNSTETTEPRPARRPAATTGASATTSSPPTTVAGRTTTRAATTEAVLGTDVDPPATTTARAAPPPARTTAPASTAAPPPEQSGFRPTRNWAWAPVPDADYYSVQFLRDGSSLYQGWPEAPRLTLPDDVVFRPGSYRWVVRPGFGPRSDARLGAAVVDSGFTVR